MWFKNHFRTDIFQIVKLPKYELQQIFKKLNSNWPELQIVPADMIPL